MLKGTKERFKSVALLSFKTTSHLVEPASFIQTGTNLMKMNDFTSSENLGLAKLNRTHSVTDSCVKINRHKNFDLTRIYFSFMVII